MDASTWISVILVGIGAVMGTLGKKWIRRIGVMLILAGVAGGAISHFYPKADAQAVKTTTIGNSNGVVTIPGNNNTVVVESDVTVKAASECPPGYNVISGSKFNNNGTAIKAPPGLKLCIVDSEFNGNGKAYDTSPGK